MMMPEMRLMVFPSMTSISNNPLPSKSSTAASNTAPHLLQLQYKKQKAEAEVNRKESTQCIFMS